MRAPKPARRLGGGKPTMARGPADQLPVPGNSIAALGCLGSGRCDRFSSQLRGSHRQPANAASRRQWFSGPPLAAAAAQARAASTAAVHGDEHGDEHHGGCGKWHGGCNQRRSSCGEWR